MEEGEAKPTLSRGLGEFVQTPVFSPFAYPDVVPSKRIEKVKSIFSVYRVSRRRNSVLQLNDEMAHDMLSNRQAKIGG